MNNLSAIASLGRGASLSKSLASVEANLPLGNAPSFIVSELNTVYSIPSSAFGPTPTKNGKRFRFMDLVTSGRYQYPTGYGSYFRSTDQIVDPFTGQTISRSNPLIIFNHE